MLLRLKTRWTGMMDSMRIMLKTIADSGVVECRVPSASVVARVQQVLMEILSWIEPELQ